jgi:crotonobetainyl-CoA:carnitine CoA-transferase CaiB-like acyl-CoA transferase
MREAARQLMRANEPNPDPNTSVVIASATLLALLAQCRYGVGQRVHVNMLVANAYANADDFLAYDGKPERAPVDAELFGHSACYRLYPARDGWVFLAVPTDAEWSLLCAAVGRPEWSADPRFARVSARSEHDAALAALLADLFLSRDADAWESALVPAGVGCVRADAATPGTFFADDPHVRENGFTPLATHARFGELRRWGPLVTCDGGPDRYGPGALAGEHTDALLAWLGHTPDDISRLRSSRIVSSEPV